MMKDRFVHFLITAFNLPLTYFPSRDKSGNKVMTDEWLHRRIKLFEEYCLPSVQSQQNKNFVWLVLFDENTPNIIKQRNEIYRKECINFFPYYLNQNQTDNKISVVNDIVKEYLKNQNKLNADFVITTRLDSDDAISRYMIGNIQDYFRENLSPAIINFDYGLQYIENYGIFKNLSESKGHFTSRMEKYIVEGQIKTIWETSHSSPPENVQFRNIKTAMPMWVEVVHGGNLMNGIIFKLRYIFDDIFIMPFKEKQLAEVFNIRLSRRSSWFNRPKLLFLWLKKAIPRKIKEFI